MTRCENCGELEAIAGAHRTSLELCGETAMLCDPAMVRRHRERRPRQSLPVAEPMKRPPPGWSW